MPLTQPSTRALHRATLVTLTLCALVSMTWFVPHSTGDLQFFLDAYRAMVDDAGLEVYAQLPNIQSGPIALLGVGLLDGLGSWAFPLAVGVMSVVAILAISRLDGVAERHPLVLATGGLVLLWWWRTFAFQGHLDDATVVALSLVALVAVQRDRRVAAALLLGVCLAIKPWAVFLLPIAMPIDRRWRERLAMPALSLVVGGLIWSPFLLATRGTLDGVRPTVRTAPDSVIRLLTGDPDAMSSGLRIAQLLVCLLAVVWVTMRGHVTAALVLGVALRLLLDGGTWPYYTAGLMAGALVFDLTCHRSRIPWAVAASTVLLPKPTWLDVLDLRALMRAVCCLGIVVAVLWAVRRMDQEAPEATVPDLDDDHRNDDLAPEFV